MRVALISIKIAIFSLSKASKARDKMVGSNGTMIAIRLVRSKLRKREEHSNSVHPAEVVLQTATNLPPVNGGTTATAPQADPLAYRGQFLWQYPPPPPHTQLYNNDQVGSLSSVPSSTPHAQRYVQKLPNTLKVQLLISILLTTNSLKLNNSITLYYYRNP